MLSQFTTEANKKCLKDAFKVPSTVYPVGRLDFDSEGLLILTNDKYLNHQLLAPAHHHQREYWVQVEGIASREALDKLETGILLSHKGKEYKTLPCTAVLLDPPPLLPDRIPPIRFRKTVPESWIKLILNEGKNRQVRRMTASVGLPTLRLVRYRIEGITLGNMNPGDMEQVGKKELYNLLRLKNE